MHVPEPATIAVDDPRSLHRNLDKVYLRLSVTSRCNLRCRYCMPAEGVMLKPNGLMAGDDELMELVHLFNTVRPTYKIRITGGEPLVRPTTPSLIARLREAYPDVRLSMTTNAILLPPVAKELKAAGLQSVNVSLDAADEVAFKSLARRDRFKETIAGLEAALDAGLKVKINGVLMRSFNGVGLIDLVELAADYGIEARFIELMPFGEGRALYEDEYYGADEAMGRILKYWQHAGTLDDGATSKRHLLKRGNREVVIGFIRTMSQPFCEVCDRMRLDAYGRLYTCLRAALGYQLLQPLRDGDTDLVTSRIESALRGKVVPDDAWPDREMAQIGG